MLDAVLIEDFYEDTTTTYYHSSAEPSQRAIAEAEDTSRAIAEVEYRSPIDSVQLSKEPELTGNWIPDITFVEKEAELEEVESNEDIIMSRKESGNMPQVSDTSDIDESNCSEEEYESSVEGQSDEGQEEACVDVQQLEVSPVKVVVKKREQTPLERRKSDWGAFFRISISILNKNRNKVMAAASKFFASVPETTSGEDYKMGIGELVEKSKTVYTDWRCPPPMDKIAFADEPAVMEEQLTEDSFFQESRSTLSMSQEPSEKISSFFTTTEDEETVNIDQHSCAEAEAFFQSSKETLKAYRDKSPRAFIFFEVNNDDMNNDQHSSEDVVEFFDSSKKSQFFLTFEMLTIISSAGRMTNLKI